MRHLIPVDRVILDENGDPVTNRNNVNFTGGRAVPVVDGGVATITVGDGASALSPTTQALFATQSLTNASTRLDLGAPYNGIWRSFIDQADTDLADGLVNFAEAGLYHISVKSAVTSGANYPFTNWPRVYLFRSWSPTTSYGTWACNPVSATPARASCSINYNGHFEVNDEAYFRVGVPAAWGTRTISNSIYITKIL